MAQGLVSTPAYRRLNSALDEAGREKLDDMLPGVRRFDNRNNGHAADWINDRISGL